MIRARRHQRSGQALVEFGLVALVLYMIVGAAITFGLWIHAAGQIQQAANVGARELSQTPLPFDSTFEDALDDPVVRRRVFDDRWLVIDLTELRRVNQNFNFFTDVVPQMPLLNQQLAPLYIQDQIPGEVPDGDDDANGIAGGPARTILRYPGALLTRTETASNSDIDYPSYVAENFIVQIPIVEQRSVGQNGGGERIRWVDVVEEVDTEDLPDDDSGANPDPFSLDNSNQDLQGVVALRINYPAQSAWLSSYRNRGPFVPNVGDPNAAVDADVQVINSDAQKGGLTNRPLIVTNANGDQIYAGTYGGTYGLGIQGATTSPQLTGNALGVRPYRRVLVSQAIFRREVFTNSTEEP